MRLTLEQLKAMSNEQLGVHWLEGEFPFEHMPACGNCLTQHDKSHSECDIHPSIRPTATWMGSSDTGIGTALRPHLEELYAMRLFYDSLYPPAEAAAEQQVAETVEVRHAIR